jgi:LmeA-like phospholipid-binding
MSNDPTKQPLPPAPPPEEPAPAAPPTVAAPAQPAARWGQEPPTQPVQQWPAPPPPPGPAAPRRDVPRQDATRQDVPRQDLPPAAATARSPVEQPTVLDAAPPTQWDRPPQPTQWDRPQQPTQWDRPQQRPPQQWQQPQWQQEPQDAPPPPWPPQPPQGQGQGQGPRPPAQPPLSPRARRRGRKRRVRRSVMAVFTIIVILIILVIADRVALAVTENDMANQFTSNGFPVKPSVTIEGFPFLTQLAAKDFNQVDISASNVPAGPVTINSIHATLTGMHISSYSSSAKATVDQLNATAFISFGALAAAGGVGSGTGITVTQDGVNKVKITAGLGGVFSDTEEAQITQTGAQTISIKVLNTGGAIGSLLSSFGSFSFNLPQGVPASLRITGLTLNSQGLNVSAAATNATFSK